MDEWITYLVLGPHNFAYLFVLKTSPCQSVEQSIVSESIQNFQQQSFYLQCNFLNYDLSQYPTVRCISI